jgi:hypothetical protein
VDRTRFDALTRLIGTGSTRRTVLGLATALGLSSLLAEAKKRRKKKKKCKSCAICQQCKQGKCKGKADGSDCGGGATCQGGACTCPAGQKFCAGSCIPDSQCCPSDCDDGNTCTTGICDQGTCIYMPLADNSACGDGTGRCRDGTCYPPPTCSPRYGPCATVDDCCSAGSTHVPTTCPSEGPEAHTCRGRSDSGQPCHDGTHCWSGANCIGYVCIGPP